MAHTIVQVNLTEIDISTTLSVHVDPGAPFVETDSAPQPVVATPTVGPHRYTIYVPHDDESVLSIGHGCDTRIKDTGITGRTKTHIHWHAKEDENQTMVTLGGGTKEGFDGYKGNMLAGATGFMMVTHNAAWLDSKEQMYIVSKEKDVVVRTGGEGKKIQLQADTGHVRIGAQEDVTIGTKGTIGIFSTSSYAIDDTTYKGDVGDHLHQTEHTTFGQKVTSGFSKVVQPVIAVGMGIAGLHKTWKKGQKHRHEFKIEAATEAPKLALELFEMGERFFKKKEEEGNVHINADNEVGLTGGEEVTIYGGKGASLSSGLSAGVTGLVSAGMKSAMYASVWSGLVSAVTSMKDVSIRGLLGEVKITGKKEVAISAEHGEVAIGAKEASYMRGKTVGLLASKKTYVGAGRNNGWGAIFETETIHLGKVAKAKDLEEVEPKHEHAIVLNDGHITLTHKQSTVYLEDDTVIVRAPNIKLSAKSGGNVTVNGAKILLD